MHRCRVAITIGLFFAFVGSALQGQPPAGYYSSAQGLTGTSLRNALHNIIDNHTVIPYSGGSFDAHDGLDLIYEDPTNPSRVLLVYSGFSVPKSTWPAYNREHAWPVSLASDSGPSYSDMFALFACDADVNSARSNKFFDDCFSSCDTHPEAPGCFYDDNSWEPRDVEKGDIARALFYMDVRYSGDSGSEPDLVLQDLPSSFGCDCMAILSTLLDWHGQDPPDAAEMAKNDLIFDLIQGNRNPFIDDPTWVYDIFGGAPPEPTGPSGVWINEIHYDNGGSDVDEGVEIAGPAGTSLTGWRVVAYNGNDGSEYDEVLLTGLTIDSESAGYGAIWLSLTGLQNGSPDGLALIDDTGAVREFLSYEGVFTASEGAASGLVSEDILVNEDGLTAVGESLQRVGTGTTSSEFSWTGPSTHSRGSLNDGQSIPAAPGVEFIRGDCNIDGFLGIGDALSLLNYLFASGPATCLDACDPSDDDQILINDPLTLLNYLFASAPAPSAPFPGCGPDPTGTTDLGCVDYFCP